MYIWELNEDLRLCMTRWTLTCRGFVDKGKVIADFQVEVMYWKNKVYFEFQEKTERSHESCTSPWAINHLINAWKKSYNHF